MNVSFCRANFRVYGLLIASLLAGASALQPSSCLGTEIVISDSLPELEPSLASEPVDIVTEPAHTMAPEPDDGGLIQHLWGGSHQRHFCPRWTASVDALMLWRGNLPSLPIFADSTGQPVIDANDTLPGTSGGPRFGLIRKIGCRHAIEGNFFQVQPFSGNAQLPAGGGPFEITDLGGLPPFGDIATGSVITSGQIRSAELNWRTGNGRSLTWLAGFRWVEWNETMTIDYEFQNPTPYGTGHLDASTGNNLYGGQFGADAMLWNRGGRVRLNAVGKAGVFYNSAAFQRSDASFTDQAGTLIPVGAVSVEADQTAFFGEVGMNASVNVTKWLAWRLGYNVFWLSGVATAPQQFVVSDIPRGTAEINTHGSVLLHGVNTGIEARW
jgi:hypothetical protein